MGVVRWHAHTFNPVTVSTWIAPAGGVVSGEPLMIESLFGMVVRNSYGGGVMPDNVHHFIAEPLVISSEQEKPRRSRKALLAWALRQAAKVGAIVTGAIVEPGKVTLMFGKPVEPPGGELDQWMATRANPPKGH
jgi:hypothetical protein